MKKVLIIMALTLIASGAYAAEKFISLKCDMDSYTDMLTPDTNYGKEIEVDSQAKFTYSGTTFSDLDTKIGYFHFAVPSEIVGKVKVVEAQFNFYVSLYKATSPYKAGEATFYAGLYPCLGTWDEMTINFNNQPSASGPGYFSIDSRKGTYKPTTGWNKFSLDRSGLKMMQAAVDNGEYNGMALYLDVTGPDQQTLMAGNYMHLLRILSRDSIKNMPNVRLGFEVITGNMINGVNINPASLGEVKAKYH
jgi:hypothetical protein